MAQVKFIRKLKGKQRERNLHRKPRSHSQRRRRKARKKSGVPRDSNKTRVCRSQRCQMLLMMNWDGFEGITVIENLGTGGHKGTLRIGDTEWSEWLVMRRRQKHP